MSNIKLVGQKELAAQLLGIDRKIRVAVEKKAITEVNKQIAEKLRQNAPTDSGALIKSITHKTKGYRYSHSNE
ncbi:MAG: hypothetical protein FWC43_01770 [Planctomycetaceae bacterium]|nr:hypothetical protein [Planctomycetaceae bacterium]